MPNFGDDTQGGAQSPGNEDRALVTLHTASASGTLTRGWAFFSADTTAGASAKLLIYTDNAGVPGTLVAASAGGAVGAGGGLTDLGAMSGSIVASTNYFVGVVYSDFQANVSVDDGLSGMNTDMGNGNVSYPSPGAWDTSGPEYDNLRVNAYAVFTTGGGATSLPVFDTFQRVLFNL